MNVIYDIRIQEQPKDFIFIVIGIILILAFLLVLARVVLYFSGRFQMSKISLLLDFVGIFAIPVIAIIFISGNINTNRNFDDYCNKLNQNNCSTVTGIPNNFKRYNINTIDEELAAFDIDEKEFDTINLYRTKNGLSKENINAISNAESITVKYIEGGDVNWIVYISIDKGSKKWYYKKDTRTAICV